MRFFTLILLSVVTFFGCQKDRKTPEVTPRFPALAEVPEGFPAVAYPEGSAHTEARWALGKKLFFDPVLSADSSVSCASCHAPHLAFSDNKAVSLGVENRPGRRNSPTLANVAYHPYFTREGGVPTLEMQVLIPLQEHDEFDFNIVAAADRLQQISEYVRMSQTAYDRTPDAFVITRALACFERSLLSGDSPYDRYFFQGKEDALTAAQKRGMTLFFSEKTGCVDCHGGFNFTDYSFKNNGLYAEYADAGKFRLTGAEADKGVFKVPTLRNIALTAPYMHDGSLLTLDEVVEHYDSGGKAHPNRAAQIRPLALTTDEKKNLVAFLHALTDETFVNNPFFSE